MTCAETGGEFEGPPEEAYSRVTNPERFQPLHAAATELLDRLEREFAVERLEGHDADDELGKKSLARPAIRLTPHDRKAAPIVVAFSEFPGLHVRFGSWRTEPFPNCGCDACDETADGEIEEDDRNGGSRRRRRVPRGDDECLCCWGAVGGNQSSGLTTAMAVLAALEAASRAPAPSR